MPLWLQILYRSVSIFILVIFIARISGKRNITRIPAYKFICYNAVAAIAALISVNVIKDITTGLIALGVWVLLPIAADYLSLKSKRFHDLITGKETVLIKHGRIIENNLKQLRLTGEELLSQLRTKNVFSMADVEFAVMETTGELNVFLKSDRKPATPHDLGMKTAPLAEPQTVVLDGNVLDEPLASLGLNREWLRVQLENLGVSQDNVFLGQVDSSGELYVDLFEDSAELPQPRVKEMTYVLLEKAQADLTAFSLETGDANAKAMYRMDAQKLKELMDKLNPYLLR